MKRKTLVELITALISILLIIIGCFVSENIGGILKIVGAVALFGVTISRWVIPSKENTTIKMILLLTLFLALLSWLIPVGSQNGTAIVSQGLKRVSLYDLLYYPIVALQSFIPQVIFILVVGGFYGVLSQTGKLKPALEKVAKIMKGKEILFLLIVSFILALLSSLFGFDLLLFMFIPALCGIIVLMGFDKITALLITFISPLIGVIGSTYGYTTIVLNQTTSTNFQTEIIAKVALLVFTYILFILFTIFRAKRIKANKNEEIKDNGVEYLGEKKQTKKANWPIYAVLGILLVLLVLGCVEWENVFEIDIFVTLHENITNFLVGKHPIFGYILTDLNEFGTWDFTVMTTMLILASVVISLIYGLKAKDSLKAFEEGVVTVARPAVLVVIAYTVVVITNWHPFTLYLTDWITNGVGAKLISLIGGSGILAELVKFIMIIINTILQTIINVDISFLAVSVLPFMASVYSESLGLLSVAQQAIYGLTLFLAPTSSLLLLGLEYLKIPYKDWFKASWKLVLFELLVIILIILILVIII